HVHTLEQISIALGVEHDHHLVFAVDPAANILGDAQLGPSGFADTGGTEHQGVAYAFTQWEGYIRLQGLDTVQPRQPTHRWQGAEWVQWVVPGGHPAKAWQWKWRKFQSFLHATDESVGRCRLDVSAKL